MTEDWRHDAACRDEDPELFFPIGTTGPALTQAADAKAVCRRCPVSGECLAFALDYGLGHGVWGGMDEGERRTLRRAPRRTRLTLAQVLDSIGDPSDLTSERRAEIVRYLTSARWTADQIGAWLNTSPHAVNRVRAQLRARADQTA